MKFKPVRELSIEQLYDKILKTKSFSSIIKSINNSSELLSKINFLSSHEFKNKSLIEKLYAIRGGYKEYPKCKICSNHAKIIANGWSEFCSGNCGYIHRWDNISSEEKEKIFNKLSKTYNKKTEAEKNKIKEIRTKTLLEKYNVDHNFKIESVKEERKKTWVNIYGHENPNLSDKVKNKIIKTNQERYGYNCPLQNEKVLKKSKETLQKNHGVNHSMQSDAVKAKFRATCNKKYNEDHHMQNAKMFDRITKKCFKWKTIIINNNEHKVQGYEDIAIFYLINSGINEESFVISNKDIEKQIGKIYWFDEGGKRHRYYPDFYLKNEMMLYEIKSEYTFERSIKNGSLDYKLNACKDLGIKVKVLVFNKKGKLVKIV